MTLEQYRIQIVERLKTFREPSQARTLLAEVDLALKSSQVSPHGQKAFWEVLTDDLDVMAQDAPLLVGVQDAGVLVLVVATAQSGIELFQRLLVSSEGNK